MENYMSLKIKAISENESFARSAVAAFCVGADPTVDVLDEVKTAVSEAVTNSIVHGYESNPEGIVTINARISGSVLHIEVTDEGVGIADIEKARKPFYTTRPDEERSGMGFTVMESFTDSLAVEPNEPRGLKVRMVKNLVPSKKARE